MSNKTVKELREIAKGLNISGRWEMSKQELIDAIVLAEKELDDKKTTKEYLLKAEPGTLVAFKRNKNKDIAMSGKLVSVEGDSVIIESKKGTLFTVSIGNIVWVKTGCRWPKWVFGLFRKVESEDEHDAVS